MSAYAACLARLFARQRFSPRLGLQTMQALCVALGAPQAAFACVLVAGTNGKGSTAALLAGALQADGRRCGLYTSPHLLRFGERICLDGHALTEAQLCRLLPPVERAAQCCAEAPSFFEMSTALALCAFAEANIDVAVLEVGLGGRLDATNVVQPCLSVITPIGADHQAILGPTMAHIAAEKAGIMRAEQPLVLAPQPEPAAAAVLCARAAALRCPLLPLLAPPLPARFAALPAFWHTNAGVAYTAAHHLGVSAPTFLRAAAQTQWPGRYQMLTATASRPAVLLDGAHNVPGVLALCAALRSDARARAAHQNGRLAVVFSALHGKDAAAMVAPLQQLLAPLFLCPVPDPRSRDPQALQALCPTAPVYTDFAAAFAAAHRQVGQTGLVVVCGSLFLIGAALQHLQGHTADPPVVG